MQRFNPGPGVGLGYEDLEGHRSLSILEVDSRWSCQGEPAFREALAVATVLGAIERSWETERWEEIQDLNCCLLSRWRMLVYWFISSGVHWLIELMDPIHCALVR